MESQQQQQQQQQQGSQQSRKGNGKSLAKTVEALKQKFNMAGDNHKTYEQLKAALEDNTNPNHQSVVDALKDMDNMYPRGAQYSRKRQRLNRGLKRLDIAKLGQEKTSAILNGLSGSDRRKALELIALDDPTVIATLAGLAGQGATHLATKAIQWLYNKYIRNISGDAGFPALGVSNKYELPNFTDGYSNNQVSLGQNNRPPSFGNGSYRSVNTCAVATLLDPFNHKYRIPRNVRLKTAISSGSYEVTLTTNASGQAFFYVQPHAGCASGAYPGESGNWFVLTNGPNSVIDPVSGAVTVESRKYPGPLYGSAASISSMCVSGMAVQCIPIANALNASGTLELIYATQPLNSSWVTVPALAPSTPASTLPTVSYYQLTDARHQARSVRLPFDTDDETFQLVSAPRSIGIGAISEAFFGLITGAPANTAVYRIHISYVYEFIPSQIAMNICNTDYALLGSATQSFVNNLTALCPVVQSLDVKEARSLATALHEVGPADHDMLLQMVQAHPLPDRNVLSRPQYVSNSAELPDLQPTNSMSEL